MIGSLNKLLRSVASFKGKSAFDKVSPILHKHFLESDQGNLLR